MWIITVVSNIPTEFQSLRDKLKEVSDEIEYHLNVYLQTCRAIDFPIFR